MTRSTLRCLSLQGLTALFFACSAADSIEGAEEMPTTAIGPSSVPLGFDHPTTEGETAFTNLEREVESLAGLTTRATSNVEYQVQLIGAVLRRSAFAGSYDDFEYANALSLELPDSRSDRPARPRSPSQRALRGS